VKNVRLDPERVQGIDAADAEHDLLSHSHFEIAAVKLRRDQAIFRIVLRDIGVEQIKLNAPDVKFKVAALPCGKTCPGAVALFPWTNLVYKQSPNKQLAWEFIRFISNAKDDLDQHQQGGFMPVWNANLDSPYAKGRPDYQSTKEMLAQPVPPTYFHPKSNELATAFGEAVVGVLYGKGQPKPLLDEAAAKMDRILQD